jgi:hypothetical protein
MPNSGRPLSILCPKCHRNGCRLVVKSFSVMTVTCAKCGHTWASLIESLPPDIQEKVRTVWVEA